MTPKRIQRIRHRKGWRAPANTLNITRPGKHGNPYPVIDGDVVTSLRKFESYLEMMIATEPKRYAALVYEVRHADFIMCFCATTSMCHGDIWIEHAKE